MTSTIIVCTDGSEPATAAASAGLALLRPVDRTIVLAVVDAVDFSLAQDASGMAGAVVSEGELVAERDANRSEGNAIVADVVAALGVDGAEPLVIEGQPGPAICDLATEVGASAIVMGSRGRGGIKRAFLGSVSDHVVRHAPCPVVVTGPGD